jgi:putative ABC transport system permease protein
MRTPPRFSEWILYHLHEKEEREFIIGDLREIYGQVFYSSGNLKANIWYWGQIIRSIRPFLLNLIYWRICMFTNYLKLAIRHMRRHWGYSLINILGLAIGMACCILIFLWVQHELSYDRFHEKAGDLYIITVTGEQGTFTSSPWALVSTLKNDFPEILKGSWYGVFPLLTRYEHKSFFENAALVGDEFLDMFTFPFVKGSPEYAFENLNSVVLTERAAFRYFGSEDPIGKVIQFENQIDMAVTGVIEDIPSNSHMAFDLVVSPIPFIGEARTHTWSRDVSSYVLLQSQADPIEVENKISETIIKYDRRYDTKLYVGLFPVRKIHLYSFYRTDPILYVYVFSAIAVIVLLIACINFMNLTTARSSIRVNEIGIRKVCGGDRKDLIKQFLGESMGLVLIALIGAVVLVYLILPGFNSLAAKQLEFNILNNGTLLAGLMLLAVFVGLASGSYPALYFSSFQPDRVLKNTFQTGSSRNSLRKTLIVTQFTASILLIIATATIYKQIQYIQSKDLGFSKDQILVVRAARQQLMTNYNTVKERLLANPDILHVSAASSIPLNVNNNNPVYWEGRGPDSYVRMNYVCVDYDYFETFDMEMSYGRSFSREYPTDQENYIVNEAALKLTGYQDPIGKMFSMWEKEGAIVGVVKDFHGTSLHNDIRPVVFVMYQNLPYSNWFIKIRGSRIAESMDFVKKTIAAVAPGYPVEPGFLDEHFQRQYINEGRLGKILTSFTGLAIFISCLGLFGLAAFLAARRSKEIAIRKVLGASIWGVMRILSREFIVLIVLANIIAWPLGLFVMSRWMRNFSYHTSIGLGVFIAAGMAALAIALLTISYQTFRAATANPADRLRNE